MTEDQIIAEAVRLTDAEGHRTLKEQQESVARHAIRLATQPEQDPALVKAMAVWDEAREAWAQNDFNHETAALKIMDAYHAPELPAVEWARYVLSDPSLYRERVLIAARFILTMAGEKQ
mgnify:FL=1